jgi:hypothetical protein
MCTSTAGTEYTRGLLVLWEALQEALRGLFSELVITEAYPDWTTSEVETVHLLEGFFGSGRVSISDFELLSPGVSRWVVGEYVNE